MPFDGAATRSLHTGSSYPLQDRFVLPTRFITRASVGRHYAWPDNRLHFRPNRSDEWA